MTIETAALLYLLPFLSYPADTSLAKRRAIGWSNRQPEPAAALRACADIAYRHDFDTLADDLFYLSDEWRIESTVA